MSTLSVYVRLCVRMCSSPCLVAMYIDTSKGTPNLFSYQRCLLSVPVDIVYMS